MRSGSLVAAAALMATACNGAGTPDPAPSAPATTGDPAIAEPTESALPPARLARGRDERVEDEAYTFAYSYPDAAAAIPGLKAILDRRLEAGRTDLVASARSGQDEARKDGFPYHPYARQTEWKVVTDLPGWLSLSSTHYEFSGGAHGMTVSDSLLWDRGARVARKPIDLFTGAAALSAALRAPFCEALDKARAKKRGEPVRHDSSDMFSECIDPAAQTLILGSSNRRTFDRIGILIAPYEAGPYAEGSYEVTLPVTGKVMAALKPQYRGAFSAAP